MPADGGKAVAENRRAAAKSAYFLPILVFRGGFEMGEKANVFNWLGNLDSNQD
jgi:hypothetical protein